MFEMKVCRRCKQEKSLDSFGKNAVRKDGKQSECLNYRHEIDKENKIKRKESRPNWEAIQQNWKNTLRILA